MSVRDELVLLVCRSRSKIRLTQDKLEQIVTHGAERNRREGVTSALMRKGDSLVQWVEGPAAAVDGLFKRVSKDPRLTDVEPLSRRRTRYRLFRGWPMTLIGRNPTSVSKTPLFGVPPSSPDRAEAIGARHAGDERLTGPQPSNAFGQDLVKDGAPLPVAAPSVDDMARSIASLELDEPESEALAAMRPIADDSFELVALLEETARRLGDLWRADEIDTLRLTVGVIRLQIAARQALWTFDPQRRLNMEDASLLVVSVPGEARAIGPVLHSGLLWRSGWRPYFRQPANWGHLFGLLERRRFDVLDIGASSVFESVNGARALANALHAARRASQNRDLKIIVGGRMFHEHNFASNSLGADYSVGSAIEIDRAVRRLIN